MLKKVNACQLHVVGHVYKSAEDVYSFVYVLYYI